MVVAVVAVVAVLAVVVGVVVSVVVMVVVADLKAIFERSPRIFFFFFAGAFGGWVAGFKGLPDWGFRGLRFRLSV